ncbi:peptidoglycan-recognition protein LB-like isoform X3 [Chrysoperla carnea]|uniref:peptidoglycan-recognition protein LB-like isoform X2 n=1 Tax=Chrysoperla carnea TaxID=189513 RepID=UPI001D077AE7|nr:peptidoglycan-recognition protein LB-like isoform X2 [Chrysoperla carnea]XP_044737981.1 peptidoglycan-recognition protein LB-like isoform X3 [Chrysoperla carnea]
MVIGSQKIGNCDLEIVSRRGWEAKPPKLVEPMPNPVPYVIIHHSYIPAACYTKHECISAMQSMQAFHQDDRGWNDIGYSFGVGSDGNAYEGRGWSAVGAHAPKYNNQSIGICVIGDWRDDLPPPEQLKTVKKLIQCGVENGYIRSDYILMGHRQVRDTECPGDALYKEIQTWPHYSPTPNQSIIEDHNILTSDFKHVSSFWHINERFVFDTKMSSKLYLCLFIVIINNIFGYITD